MTKQSSIDKLSDTQLLWLYNDTRSREYYGELYLRYLTHLYGLFLRYTPDHEQAKLAALELYEKLSERLLVDTEVITTFSEWLYLEAKGFAKERFLDNPESTLKSNQLTEHLTADELELLLRVQEGEVELLDMIERHLDQLTKPQRECMRLFFVEKETFEDISSRLGYLTQDIRGHIEKGIHILASVESETERSGK